MTNGSQIISLSLGIILFFLLGIDMIQISMKKSYYEKPDEYYFFFFYKKKPKR